MARSRAALCPCSPSWPSGEGSAAGLVVTARRGGGQVTRGGRSWWCLSHGTAPPSRILTCQGEASRFVKLLMAPGSKGLVQEDFVPLLQGTGTCRKTHVDMWTDGHRHGRTRGHRVPGKHTQTDGHRNGQTPKLAQGSSPNRQPRPLCVPQDVVNRHPSLFFLKERPQSSTRAASPRSVVRDVRDPCVDPVTPFP